MWASGVTKVCGVGVSSLSSCYLTFWVLAGSSCCQSPLRRGASWVSCTLEMSKRALAIVKLKRRVMMAIIFMK